MRKTTKLIKGGHRGLRDSRHMLLLLRFYVFFKSRDFLRFLPCFVHFLDLWLYPYGNSGCQRRLPRKNYKKCFRNTWLIVAITMQDWFRVSFISVPALCRVEARYRVRHCGRRYQRSRRERDQGEQRQSHHVRCHSVVVSVRSSCLSERTKQNFSC